MNDDSAHLPRELPAPPPKGADGVAGRRRAARRTVAVGVTVTLACALLVLSPLLLGRGNLNRFLVAFGLLGVFFGGSCVLHGGWDWLRAGRLR